MQKLKFSAVSLVLFVFFILFPKSALAQYYNVDSFESEININQDTSLTVKEKIEVNFLSPRHGIFRIIPVIYSYRGKTINSRLSVLTVTDEKGKSYKYTKERNNQSLSLKIGDPDLEISGVKVYIITYKVTGILQKYGDSYELYWNVTGHEWDGDILKSSAKVSSPNANITDTACYSGAFGDVSIGCKTYFTADKASFVSNKVLTYGEDFTIVTSFSAQNSFIPPGKLEVFLNLLSDNWGYLISPIPLYLILLFWYKRGRDRKFSGENVYYREENASVETKPVFAREHLPLVYHPIKGLSPSEIGVLVDEKVDIEDILAEIMELARLGYFEIRKIVKKKLLGTDTEYAFIKKDKYSDDSERVNLKDYQEYLLKEIFRSTIIHKSVEVAEKFFKGHSPELDEARKLLIKKDYVLLGGLKNHFYEGLPVFKDKLYDHMANEHYFYENPEKVRSKWLSIYTVLGFAGLWATVMFSNLTANPGPIIALVLLSIPGAFFAHSMPRRTPKGYSLKRQIEGLSWYLEKGKWRYEISEKHLFIEEVLPIAIALGVVDNLARDMGDLGVKPPSYFAGASTGSFSNDIATFRTTSTNSFFSTPSGKWSGSSSWSGGSGFSGGSSGGGFGGGGGGSW